MKFGVMVARYDHTYRRAPQGARGLKYLPQCLDDQRIGVAPRKGRVG
mgnify:CR=1 FL=1